MEATVSHHRCSPECLDGGIDVPGCVFKEEINFSLFNLWNPLSAMTEAGLEQGQGDEPSESPTDGCNKFSQMQTIF